MILVDDQGLHEEGDTNKPTPIYQGMYVICTAYVTGAYTHILYLLSFVQPLPPVPIPPLSSPLLTSCQGGRDMLQVKVPWRLPPLP